MNPYLPNTDSDRASMLEAIGVSSFDELLSAIPKAVRAFSINLPKALSELELEKHMDAVLASTATSRSHLSFLGGGAYEHYIPAAVSAISSRGEFFTAYTPYQAEASQGTLQVIYEYQTMMARLTDMAVSTASHYDGATSLAESVLMAVQHTRKRKVLLSAAVHPDYRAVVKTYLSTCGAEIVEVPFSRDGGHDAVELDAALDDTVACFVAQTPNVFGVIEDLTGVSDKVRACKALFICVANPMSLAVLKSPGAWGADIACGDAQPFGNAVSFGGPHLGYIAVTKAFMRKVPGRLVGMTEDADGKRAFVLTLQAREQHIRRQRASSNICSNQALCALQACVYLACVGQEGLTAIAEKNVSNAMVLREKLAAVDGCEVVFDSPCFNECVVRLSKPVSEVVAQCGEQNILPGVPLGEWYPDFSDCLLVCATETKSGEEIDRFVTVLEGVLKQCEGVCANA